MGKLNINLFIIPLAGDFGTCDIDRRGLPSETGPAPEDGTRSRIASIQKGVTKFVAGRWLEHGKLWST